MWPKPVGWTVTSGCRASFARSSYPTEFIIPPIELQTVSSKILNFIVKLGGCEERSETHANQDLVRARQILVALVGVHRPSGWFLRLSGRWAANISNWVFVKPLKSVKKKWKQNAFQPVKVVNPSAVTNSLHIACL
jgi:hypothetical protein